MATIGRLDNIQVGTKGFDCYIKHMKQYFIANDVPESTMFLSGIGAKYMSCYVTWYTEGQMV